MPVLLPVPVGTEPSGPGLCRPPPERRPLARRSPRASGGSLVASSFGGFLSSPEKVGPARALAGAGGCWVLLVRGSNPSGCLLQGPGGLCPPKAGLAASPRCSLTDGSDTAFIFLILKKNPLYMVEESPPCSLLGAAGPWGCAGAGTHRAHPGGMETPGPSEGSAGETG